VEAKKKVKSMYNVQFKVDTVTHMKLVLFFFRLIVSCQTMCF